MDKAWAALNDAALREAHEMNPQELANTMWAYATLEKFPGDDILEALEEAVCGMAQNMNGQDTSKITWAYAKLEREPATATRAALEEAAARSR